MHKIAVILSGCGFLDGAEIRESVLTLLALSQQGYQVGKEVSIFAPDISQLHVVDHLKQNPYEGETRNVLQESARIARSQISPLCELNMQGFSAILMPGGFGVAKNLSDFALKGVAGEVYPKLKKIIQQAHSQKKPIGAICIASAIICMALQQYHPTVTLGHQDNDASRAIKSIQSSHVKCQADAICFDPKNKIISTPAYMIDDASLSDIHRGIFACVQKVLALLQD